MECPQCHFENPPGSLRCTKCDSDFDLAGATVDGGVRTSTRGGVASGWSRPAEDARGFSTASQALQPGSVLGGRYEILQLLGEGGMGAVYKARDRELDRLVALKVIRPELANQPEVLRRFKQELILARQVTHKNVIRIFDLGEADGIKFISMDYIQGQDLRSLLRQKGKLAPAEAGAIMIQVCRALEAAHLEGVVHRDLKPQNIMLDSQGRATVMDFGIARSMELTGMTQTGALLGTPDYMSPEQAKGQEVDARSDLFTLGIIFYELLTGKVPYTADTVLGTLLKRTQERARPPSELDPTIPRYLNDLVVRCLEIGPAARYQSAAEIAKDLETETAPRPATLRLRLPRFRIVEGHQIRWIVAGLVALPLIALAIIFRAKVFTPPVKPGSSAPPVSLAIIPFRNASGDPSLDWVGSTLSEMLNTDVGQSAALRTVPAGRVNQILHDLQLGPESSLDAVTIGKLAKNIDAQTVVWGKYVKLGDQIHVDATLDDLEHDRSVALQADAPNAQGIPGATDRLAQAIRQNLTLSSSAVKELEAQAFKPSTQSIVALRAYNNGVELERQGRHLEAQKKFESATQTDPGFALAYSRLAQTYSTLGYDNQAELASQKAVELSQSLPPQEQRRIAAAHAEITNDTAKALAAYEDLAKAAPGDPDVQFALGSLYENSGDYDQARAHYGNVLDRDPKSAEALLGLGRVEIRSDNPQGGLQNLSRALPLTIEADNQEERANVLQAIGVAYRHLGKQEEALRNYQESLAIKRRLDDKRGAASSLNQMAQVQELLGQSDQAAKSYNEALELRRQIGDKKGEGDTLIDLGTLYHDRGSYDEALKLFTQSLEIQREVGDEDNQALCLSNIGSCYFYSGKYQDALTYFQQALQLREKTKQTSDIALTVHNLADTEARLGEYTNALNSYLRALDLYRRGGDKRGAAIESSSIGTLFEYQGRYGAAVNSNEEALKAFRDIGDRSFWMVEILSGYGEALALAGRGDESTKVLDEAMALARELKNQPLEAEAIGDKGDSAFYRGDYKSASKFYDQALALASRTKDRDKLLVAKFDVAKVAVKAGRSREAINALKALSQEADRLGLKYLSVECSVYMTEALVNTKDYLRARQEIEPALVKSQRLGLRGLSAKGEFLLGTTLRLTGKTSEAAGHYTAALSLLEEIRKEPGTDRVIGRADLSSLYRESQSRTGKI